MKMIRSHHRTWNETHKQIKTLLFDCYIKPIKNRKRYASIFLNKLKRNKIIDDYSVEYMNHRLWVIVRNLDQQKTFSYAVELKVTKYIRELKLTEDVHEW